MLVLSYDQLCETKPLITTKERAFPNLDTSASKNGVSFSIATVFKDQDSTVVILIELSVCHITLGLSDPREGRLLGFE